MIRLAISTDANGHSYNATLIASILRRTKLPVHVRCWCRGFLPESFQMGRLKVEFLPAEEEVTGRYPSSSGPAAYDRLLVIRDCPDWDRCMVMDYDQLVLCDLAPLFEMDLGDYLLAAHMQGTGVDMDYAMRVWLKRPIPEGWEHVGSHPYFLMPPLLNLKAMRDSGTWETFLAAHAAFGADEQLSLTAATEGRSLPLEAKWNLFPKLHIKEEEVPEGIIHWSGWPKPWHRDANVWRPDIWESEKSSWEHLRMGIWEKPLAIEVMPSDEREVQALAKRGWRVKVFRDSSEAGDADSSSQQKQFPDLTFYTGGPTEFQKLLAQDGGKIDSVRIGPWEDAADWLEGSEVAPQYLVIRGAMDAAEVDRIRAVGYDSEARLMSGEWPAGGPLPRALDFHPCTKASGLGAGEDLFLKFGNKLNGQLTFGDKPKVQEVKEKKKIGILVTASADDHRFIKPLLRSIRRNFLPGHEKKVFLFTDKEVEPAADLWVMPLKQDEQPEASAGSRYPIFSEHAKTFGGMDFLFSLDVNMFVIGKVGEEIFGDLVGTLHPGFHDKTRDQFTYDQQPECAAYISPHEGHHYFCDGFQGGASGSYLQAIQTIAGRIASDAERGITAVWGDESHWNRYLIDHGPDVILSPSYSWYPDGGSKDLEGKIAIVSKAVALAGQF